VGFVVCGCGLWLVEVGSGHLNWALRIFDLRPRKPKNTRPDSGSASSAAIA